MFDRIRAIPAGQKYRYLLIGISCLLFLSPLALIPGLAGNSDFCGELCLRRFFLYFPSMSLEDLKNQISLAWIGVIAFCIILTVTFFFGRMWCSYLCPVGGFPELISRMLDDRWKIEYRALPQIPIRYGYFSVYLVLMPMLGISACTLCNFITVPRLFEALNGDRIGLAFMLSSIGLANLSLLFLLGFLASKGRAYCQFLCPIGAIDGLVNRMGAGFRFTRRIRVERSRCTGCNICARNCMTGAIKMIDRIAVVDQHSCMSCHECVDVCDWGAIDWLSVPPNEGKPKRMKKGVEFFPQPRWVALHSENKKHTVRPGKLLAAVFLMAALTFILANQALAKKRNSDPDGCLSCHQLSGLDYIDKRGLRRSASIDVSHYYSSLHGSVPCKDCHRKIESYPHDPANGEVDCAESCHVKEPSRGEAYTHKGIVREFSESVHGKGKTKGFTGGNRLDESRNDQNPSCRTCHRNTLYIDEEHLPEFMKDFAHTKTECGNCHAGEVWLGQFGGHILRRFRETRLDKKRQNAICKKCHANQPRMKKVLRRNEKSGKKEKPGHRFIMASASYDMSLHGKLVNRGNPAGASCNDCHARKDRKHAILKKDDPRSGTHPENLPQTCGQSACHAYARHPANRSFLETDMHDPDFIPISADTESSAWTKSLYLLAPLAAIPGIGVLFLTLRPPGKKSVVFSRFGGDSFQEKMIGRKPKKAKKSS